jgi:hypothetical protein
MDATFGASKLTHLYRDLCKDFLAAPPENFDGVIALKEK